MILKKSQLYLGVFFSHRGGYSLKELWFNLGLLKFTHRCGLSKSTGSAGLGEDNNEDEYPNLNDSEGSYDTYCVIENKIGRVNDVCPSWNNKKRGYSNSIRSCNQIDFCNSVCGEGENSSQIQHFNRITSTNSSDFTQLEPIESDVEGGSTQVESTTAGDSTPSYKHLWVLCEECYTLNYKRFLKERFYICEWCDSHLKMNSSERIGLLIDPNTWDPMNEKIASIDPIEWDSEEAFIEWDPEEDPSEWDYEEDPSELDPEEDPSEWGPKKDPSELDPDENLRELDSEEDPSEWDSEEDPSELDSEENPSELDPEEDPSELDSEENPSELDPEEDPRELNSQENPQELDSEEDPRELDSEEDPRELDSDEDPRELDPEEDPGELNSEEDPSELDFKDDPYIDRIESYQKKTGLTEAIQTGIGQLNGIPIAMGVMEFEFMGGSMGSVVGEKITRLIEYAAHQSLPLILVCASGGARMQEGSLSLMQMAKISSALYHFQRYQNLFYVSILTSPTTGGVTASFGMLGDIIVAEPNAYIAFAGKRVIEQTLNKEVPEGSQETEYLFDKGSFDLVVPRKTFKRVLTELFHSHGFFPLNQNSIE